MSIKIEYKDWVKIWICVYIVCFYIIEFEKFSNYHLSCVFFHQFLNVHILKLTFTTPAFVKCISRIADISLVKNESKSFFDSTSHLFPFICHSHALPLHTHLLYSIESPMVQALEHKERFILPFEHLQLASSSLQVAETGDSGANVM